MKIAVSGKGGVGKSTISAAIILTLARRGERVLALDSDPDANLAVALGFPLAVREEIVPISKRIDLIEQRTESDVNQFGRVFKLNPEVGDIAEKYAASYGGVDLLVLGAVSTGGSGCACPANTFARALVTDLVLYKNQSLVMDMEAGIEHLGRATAGGVETMLIVVEPGQRSVDCAKTVLRMAGEIGIRRRMLVGNKVADAREEQFLREAMPEHKFIAMLPYSPLLRRGDREGISALDAADEELVSQFEKIVKELGA